MHRRELCPIISLVILVVTGCTDLRNGILTQIQINISENDTGNQVNPTEENNDTCKETGELPVEYPKSSIYALDTLCSPKRDIRWVDNLSLDLDQELTGMEIIAYKIKWFSGSWSPWYVPGVNDLYQKVSSGEPKRRAWACFNDHTHRYLAVPVEYAENLRTFNEFDKGLVTESIQPSGAHEVENPPENNDQWSQSVALNSDTEIVNRKIVAYQIRWTCDEWSGWILPGYEDVYVKNSEELMRWWANFDDHTHRYIYFDVADVQDTD